MVNTIQFLNNYLLFASEVRLHTCQVYLSEMQKDRLKSNNKKMLMLRMMEDYISSTEDLAMWLLATSKRSDNKSDDVWKKLLQEDVPISNSKNGRNKKSISFLKTLSRVKKPETLLKKLDLIPIQKISEATKETKDELEKSLKYIIEGISSSLKSRETKKSVLVRAHNKIKHGMMVYLDRDCLNNLWFRDLNKKKGSREFNLAFNLEKASKIYSAVQVNTHAIQAIIQLNLLDIKYRIKNTRGMSLIKKQDLFRQIEEQEV